MKNIRKSYGQGESAITFCAGMNKRGLLLACCILLLISGLSSCRQKGAPILVKIGLTHGKSHSFTKALELFARRLEEKTGGRYVARVYYGSQIGSEKEMQEMLSVGSLEMTVTGLLNTYQPLFSVFEMPYLYDSRQHVLRVLESTVMEEVTLPLHQQGLHLIGFYENGYRHITNSKKPVHVPADLAGMMIRVPENPAQIQTFKALSAIPTPLSFSELYTALVQGVADGQENPLQNIWYGRLYEAQSHIAMTGHIYNAAYVLIGNTFWDSLPVADREIFNACMKESVQWQLQYMEAADQSLEEELKQAGMAFTYPDKKAFKKATLPAYEAIYSELGPKARSLVQQVKALNDSAQARGRVFYINSYHRGYAPSDSIARGIENVMQEHGVVLETYYMDTKRNTTREHTQKVVGEVLEKIKTFKPGVIIVSDDNAVKDVVLPYLKEGPIPVIFCGVNWSAAEYSLPAAHVSGMLEVLPLPELLDTIKQYYPRASRLAILSENTLSEQKNKQVLDSLFRKRGLQPHYSLVNNFEEWQGAFIALNREADLIYLPTNGAIKGWNDDEAIRFVRENIKKPLLTCDDFMMPFAVLGFTKVAKEQGQWAALRAVELLEGKSIADIPLSRNNQYTVWINHGLATSIGLHFSDSLRANSKVVTSNQQ